MYIPGMIGIKRIENCLLCGAETAELGSICLNCKSKCQIISSNYCKICGIPIISEIGECLRCRSAGYSFQSGSSLFEYKDVSREILYQYKFRKRLQIGEWYAFLIYQAIEEKFTNHIIVPSPYRSYKKLKKGWDQVELIIKILNNKYNYNIKKILKRYGSLDQKKLDLAGRQNNLSGKIHLKKRVDIKGKNCLFIDDIFTTGATAEECTKVLLAGGAKNISVLTIAID